MIVFRASITKKPNDNTKKGINHAHHWTINNKKINDYIKRGRPLTILQKRRRPLAIFEAPIKNKKI